MNFKSYNRKEKTLLIIGCFAILAAIVILICISYPTLFGGKKVRFESSYKDKAVTLEATYWKADSPEYAVLICPGYSCDRQKWRPMANLFAANNLAVMTFDYAGQGASSSTIGFDNAKTDAIPVEIADAIELLHSLSGLDYENIILVGHSMGGRSILRLLYDYNSPDAKTSIVHRPIKSVILFSPEVNYNFNAQASLFAGTSDENEEPWRSYSAAYTKGVDVYLFGSTADDIVSDEDVLSIYAHMGGSGAPASGKWQGYTVNEVGSHISVGITGGVLHSYEMYSPKFCRFVKDALHLEKYSPVNFSLIYVGWIFALSGLALVLLVLNSKADFSDKTFHEEHGLPVLNNESSFLKHKLLMWLPTCIVAFLLCSLCVVLPFGSPVMNIPYMCFISGYGIAMLIAYRKGHFKGTDGTLPRPTLKCKSSGKKELVTAILLSCGLTFFVWFVLILTMYKLPPLNLRLFWLIFATGLMAIGFYISGCETDMLKISHASRKTVILYSLIQYVPLFLLVLFYLVIKSYSGMIGQAQNLLLMYIFCIPIGNFLRVKSGNRLIGALVSAFIFQAIMITSAALIAIF